MCAGDVEDHAVLLCSLLLGFGLDSYVVIGTRRSVDDIAREYTWVLTRYADSASVYTVLFWDPITGERTAPGGRTPSGDEFCTIGCVFNDETFLANHALDDSVAACSWNWDDISKWKPVDTSMLAQLQSVPDVPIALSSMDSVNLSTLLEACLKTEVAKVRQEEADLAPDTLDRRLFNTSWDFALERRLQLALSCYETVRTNM